jgi:hypothetical protein
MNNDSKRPNHQPETEFIGGFYEFESEALSPDDPEFKARKGRGRPADRKRDRQFDCDDDSPTQS